MKLVIAILLVCVPLRAATYYVSTTGDNGDPGTLAEPWATVNYGFTQLATGDTLILLEGTHTPTAVPTLTVNSATIIGTNTDAIVTSRGFYVSGTNNTIRSLTFEAVTINTGISGSCINVATNAHSTKVYDCRFLNMTNTGQNSYSVMMRSGIYNTPRLYQPWYIGANDCHYSNNFHSVYAGGHVYRLNGSNNIVEKCWIENGFAGDVFMLHGCSNIVRDNFITNCTSGSGFLHADLLQTYSNTGETTAPYLDSFGHIVERNQFWDVLHAIAQLEKEDSADYENRYETNSNTGGWLIRNNLFVRCGPVSGSICNVDIPTTWINNTFIACGTNATSSGEVIGLSIWNPEIRLKGAATNTTIVNNAFIGCGRNTNGGWFSYSIHDMDSNAVNVVTYSNLVVHWTGSGWLPKNPDVQYSSYTLDGNLVEVTQPAPDINPGTDPLLVEWGGRSYRPLYGSALIDSGTNTSLVSSDIEGTQRSKGDGHDVGAWEFDPNLRLHFDFEQTNIASGFIMDTTGYGHHATNFWTTNWITTEASPSGLAGTWTFSGTNETDPPNVYRESQYAAVTNLTDLTYFTNGTIAVWVRWATTAERHDTILDAGYPSMYSTNPEDSTNSFSLKYGWPNPGEGAAIGPVFRRYDADGDDTTGAVIEWTQTRDGTTWYHLAVTWNTNGAVIGYQNGAVVATNDWPYPYVRVTGSPELPYSPFTRCPWLAIGSHIHEGTPYWDRDLGDNYPNAGFLEGAIDELRIYDRTLSGGEVVALYSQQFQGTDAAPPAATNRVMNAATVNAGVIRRP